jgi:hypothetical protein
MTSTKASPSIDMESGEVAETVLETQTPHDTFSLRRPMSNESFPTIEIRESLPEDESVDECKARFSEDVEDQRQWYRRCYLVPFTDFIK